MAYGCPGRHQGWVEDGGAPVTEGQGLKDGGGPRVLQVHLRLGGSGWRSAQRFPRGRLMLGDGWWGHVSSFRDGQRVLWQRRLITRRGHRETAARLPWRCAVLGGVPRTARTGLLHEDQSFLGGVLLLVSWGGHGISKGTCSRGPVPVGLRRVHWSRGSGAPGGHGSPWLPQMSVPWCWVGPPLETTTSQAPDPVKKMWGWG